MFQPVKKLKTPQSVLFILIICM